MLAGSCPTGGQRGQLPASRILRGQNPEGSQACRFARGAANEIRVGNQSQDREADRPDHFAIYAVSGGQGDQVMEENQLRTQAKNLVFPLNEYLSFSSESHFFLLPSA